MEGVKIKLRSKSRSASKARNNDDAQARLYYQIFGGPIEAVYEEDINRPQELIRYIEQTGLSQAQNNYFKVPYVMLFQNDIIDLKHGKIEPHLTSQLNPIKICWKFIKNDQFSLNYFFKHRNIIPDTDFLQKQLFRFAIEQLQDKKFVPSQADVKFIQKTAFLRRYRKNEGPIAPLVGAILTACLTEAELPTASIQEQFSFLDKDGHEAIADHVIFQENDRPILICEDKFNTINDGILQNFDQLRTFAATDKGSKFDLVYGIASTFNEWVFCCYLCPEEGKDVTAKNFFTSNYYKMNYDAQGYEPLADSIIDIIQKIRGFFLADVDAVVLKTFEKEGKMIIEK